MALLIRRSVRGGRLHGAGATPLPASRQTGVIPSLAASFLSSSAAGAAARIGGSPVRSKGQCIYRMLCDGSGSTQVGHNKSMFRAMINGLKRYWASMDISEKAGTVGALAFGVWSLKVASDMNDLRMDLAYIDEQNKAGSRDVLNSQDH
ncbi:unnamed protein product [Urochloa humidicola]